MANTPRRPVSAFDAAEALFKPAKPKPSPAREKPAIPHTKQLVSIKLDSDVLEHFQDAGPGWQDRINDALRGIMQANSQA